MNQNRTASETERVAEIAEQVRRIQQETKCEIHNFADYSDGVSFTVSTELDAYKSAYVYRLMPRVRVTFAPNCGEWLVQIYSK